jgi:alpha-tubulin suppressor-like RCC1 family protein
LGQLIVITLHTRSGSRQSPGLGVRPRIEGRREVSDAGQICPIAAQPPVVAFSPAPLHMTFRPTRYELVACLALGLSFIVGGAPGGGSSVHHSALLTVGGTVWTAGKNSNGEIGDDTVQERLVRVPVLAGASAVAVGSNHTVALVGGVAHAWGHGTYGQLCDDMQIGHRVPTPVPAISDVVGVGAASSVTYLLRSDGTLYSCGWSFHGLIGDGSANVERLTPVAVSGITDAIAVAGGTTHALALRANGTVLSWGDGAFGKLGDGTTASRLTPGPVSGLTNIVAIAAGHHHSLALDASGHVWAWGTGFYGALGEGGTADRYAPIQVPGLTNVTAIAAGGFHSVAVTANQVWTWAATARGSSGRDRRETWRPPRWSRD